MGYLVNLGKEDSMILFFSLTRGSFKNKLTGSLSLITVFIIVSVFSDISTSAPQQILPTSTYPLIGKSGDMFFVDSSAAEAEGNRVRSWTISVPVWVPGYRGRFTVGGVEVGGEPDGDFWDRLFSSELSLDFYFVGLVNYNWRHWNFHLDIFAGTIGNSAKFTLDDNTVVNATLNMWMPSIYAGYDFLYNSSPIGPITNWQVYLGGRIYSVDLEVVLPEKLGEKNGDTSWFTFIVGTDITIKILNRLNLKLSGDIGSITASADPALFGVAALYYRPWDLFSASLGYAAIHIDRIGEGSSDIELKADLAGPVLAIAFHL